MRHLAGALLVITAVVIAVTTQSPLAIGMIIVGIIVGLPLHKGDECITEPQ